VTITDDKSERLHGLFVNGGVSWEATRRLTASLAFRSPYLKKGDGRSLLRYEVAGAGTDIRIEAEAVNEYLQPWIVGAGCAYSLSEAWSFAAELAWFGWSAYESPITTSPSSGLSGTSSGPGPEGSIWLPRGCSASPL
jgi:long-subunit fatty acid transport protein